MKPNVDASVFEGLQRLDPVHAVCSAGDVHSTVKQALALQGTKLRGRSLRVMPCGKRTKGRGGVAKPGHEVYMSPSPSKGKTFVVHFTF